ncbi:hypothetical protein GLOTRDRAFT_137972 [Gloeophyllum trabeum ATCC 11539]|uniref:CAP-Gly domain-containing protein n=1 Tax=Gloeophyllum trabeum (strain ATCC 11539 / FP-39264 / Madison 617) TaxID=670483 RepID=S7RSV5_GLOTA|nr:uncharacterized protein GLOTRDRAFT_137972 [Gloeophyllum trabeum ATCC 11539]EPQ56159.1 hypothetical protein GLOTRDRAFT_137972 [Gloeophyllum trabeum ATCC 11539]
MSGTVTVFVKSPDTRSERRFDLHLTVGQLKGKLELVTGIPVSNQAISVLNSEADAQVVGTLDDESKPLGFYGLRDHQVLNVVDTDPATSLTGQLNDVSQVQKFELSESEYQKRQDSVLAYKQQHKLGRFADKKEDESTHQPAPEVNIPIGARCEVESSEPGLHKRGTVRFVGPTKFASTGIWVGIEYDEPFGKNDGSVQGERYFTCRPNYGVFVRPEKVRVGDFPVEDINMEDEEI